MIYFLKVNSKFTGGYDSFSSKVVRAKNEIRAREIANQIVGDEGSIWKDVNKVSCEWLDCKDKEEVICADYHSG